MQLSLWTGAALTGPLAIAQDAAVKGVLFALSKTQDSRMFYYLPMLAS